MKTTKIEANPCPHCGQVFDAATSFGDASPRPGDITFCVECGEWNIFDNDLKLVKPNDDELVSFAGSLECQEVRKAWLRFKEQGRTDAKRNH